MTTEPLKHQTRRARQKKVAAMLEEIARMVEKIKANEAVRYPVAQAAAAQIAAGATNCQYLGNGRAEGLE